MAEDKQQTGRRWSKDFVEHLRTVHFALIAVCIAVVILGSAATKSEINRAHEQIDHIRTLRDQPWTMSWLKKSALASMAAPPPCLSRCVLEIEGTTAEHAQFRTRVELSSVIGSFVTLNSKHSKFIGTLGDNPNGSSIAASGLNDSDSIAAPTSLRDFIDIWDILNSGAVVHNIATSPQCLMGENEFNVTEVPCHWIKEESGEKALGAVWFFQLFFKVPRYKKLDFLNGRPTEYYYKIDIQTDTQTSIFFLLPVHVEDDISVNPQTILIGEHPTWEWRTGRFETAFRELANVSKAYQDSKLDEAEAIIAAEEARTGESLEAFGMKVPAEAAIRWGGGAVLIWVVQLYLWAHLFEFKNKLGSQDEGWNVAWVGVYETRPARIMLYASLLLFPLAGALTVGIRGLYISNFKWYSWLALAAIAIITLLLSILACIALPRKQELIENEQKGQGAAAP